MHFQVVSFDNQSLGTLKIKFYCVFLSFLASDFLDIIVEVKINIEEKGILK